MIGCWLLLALAVALYREWVIRSRPPLFKSLGFYESAIPVTTFEQDVQRPTSWTDKRATIVVDEATFDQRARGAVEQTVGVLVVGGTWGGTAAALAASEAGVDVLLATEHDWRQEMLSRAGMLLTEDAPSVEPSSLEWEIRTKFANRMKRAMPYEIVDFLEEKMESLPTLSLQSQYSVIAMNRDDSRLLHRALLQNNENPDDMLSVRFSLLIDGTDDGSLLALAGVETLSGWDSTESTGEPRTLSADALRHLAEGYSMSGRTIVGIGKRLDGMRVQMGMTDRGYHGTFTAPTYASTCWERDTKTKAVMIGMTVLRARSTDCTAQFNIQSPFRDTVEIFFINHGSDSLSFTVRTGSGIPLSLEMHADPSKPFVRIGAFPTSPESPLVIQMHSSLPTDKIEGVIVRKMNTAASPFQRMLLRTQELLFSAGPWGTTAYDIYVHSTSQPVPPTLLLNGVTLPTERAGNDTFVVHHVSLPFGQQSLYIAEQSLSGFITLVPLSPSDSEIPLTPSSNPMITGAQAWEVTPTESGTVLLKAPRNACAVSCTFSLVEKGTTLPVFDGSRTRFVGTPTASVLLDTASVKAGVTYVVSLITAGSEPITPSLSYLGRGSDLISIGNNSAIVEPPTEGHMYDIWVRASRAKHAKVKLHDKEITVGSLGSWEYAGTTIVMNNDISINAGGTVELLALPNTFLDSYQTTMRPHESLRIPANNLPVGTYGIGIIGADTASTISVRDEVNHSVQHMTFEKQTDFRIAPERLTIAHRNITLESPADWPQDITLFELPISPMFNSPMAQSGALFVPLQASSPNPNDTILASGCGAMIFDPMRSGIAPITIGLIGDPRLYDRTHDIMEDLFAYVRFGKPSGLCSPSNDPTCDSRRYVRDPSIFETDDAQSLHPMIVDGRRLRGMDVLSVSGAFAIPIECGSFCARICVPGSIVNSRCVDATKNQPAISTALVAVRGTNTLPTIASLDEHALQTTSLLFRQLRRDGVFKTNPTYLETPFEGRDFSLTLAMIVSETEPNVLSANTTISATHAASRALRSVSTEMAIGEAVGHAASFALTEEHESLAFIARSSDAMKRLQRSLIHRGTIIIPIFDASNDRLLLKEIQSRILEGASRVVPTRTNNRLTFHTEIFPNNDATTLRGRVYGERPIQTMRDALVLLPGSPGDGNLLNLLRFGIANGFVTQKMLFFSLDEIMRQPVDDELLLKAHYLFRVQEARNPSE